MSASSVLSPVCIPFHLSQLSVLLQHSPTTVSYPSGKLVMKAWALACLAADTTSASVAPGFPKRIFSITEVPNSTGSCRQQQKHTNGVRELGRYIQVRRRIDRQTGE